MNLNYLTDPNKQYQDRNGVNNVNGFIRVYIDGTDDFAPTYRNFEGTLNPRDIRIDNNGRCVIIVDDSKVYRVECYDRDGGLLWTQHPLFVQGGGGSEYDGDVSDATSTFTKDEGDTSEISSGSTLKVLFTKISKFFAGLKRVAFTGSYGDLEDTPTIPAPQVQSDWNQYNSSAVDYIKNKPSIPAAQVQSDWNESDNTKADYIKNKPSIPDVSGKLNINGDNATAAGSSAIVDKIAYNNDPTIDDTSAIIQKNGNGNWEKISLSGIWEYIKSKFVPVISHGYKSASKTVVSGEENHVTLSPAINLPTKRANYAVAIITAYLRVDPNGTSLAGVSDKAKIEIDIDGSSIDTWVPVFEDGLYRASPKTTFQFKFSPALYPSTVTASVYSLNAPVGSGVTCYFHITLLGNDTNF